MSGDRRAVPPGAAFDELAGLVLSDSSFDTVMTAVATAGKRLLPSAKEVSVTMIRRGRPQTVASTGDVAAALDRQQYLEQAGPCMTAAQDGELVVLPDAAGSARWPRFADAAREQGVGSSLCVPVAAADRVLAGVNLYSDRLAGFAADDVELARALAAYAALALAHLDLDQSRQCAADDLQRVLASRGVIDMAKGIVMAERGCSAETAFQALVAMSQHSNRKLRDVARQLVDGTASGERARGPYVGEARRGSAPLSWQMVP